MVPVCEADEALEGPKSGKAERSPGCERVQHSLCSFEAYEIRKPGSN